MRRVLTLLAMLIFAAPIFARGTLAQDTGPQPWRINNIPLDMPMDEELNGEFLEGIYQEKLMDRLISSVLNEWPIYHIHSTLKAKKGKLTKADSKAGADTDPENDQMDLYFSSAADQRRVFWIRSHRPLSGNADADGMANMLKLTEGNFGKPDRVVSDAEMPGNVILVMVDPAIAADEQARLKAALPDPLTLSHDDFVDFWAMDLQSRAKILGRDFRGALVMINSFQGKFTGLQTELLDLKRAQTVLVLP